MSVLYFLLLGPWAPTICTAFNYTATTGAFPLQATNGSATASDFSLFFDVTANWPDAGSAQGSRQITFTGPEYPTNMYWAVKYSGGQGTISISPGVGAGCFPGSGICPFYPETEGELIVHGGISSVSIWGGLFSFGPNSGSIIVSVSGTVCSGAGDSGLQSSHRRCHIEDEFPRGDIECAGDNCDRDTEQIAGANLLGGTQIDVPVVQEHGFTDYVFAQADQLPANPSPMIGNPTYVFGSSSIPFSRFGIPDPLPNGDHEFQIMFDGMSFPLQANQEFSFTDYVPGGVQKFYVTGFNAAEMLDRTAAPTFTHAFQFVAEGATHVAVGAIVPGNYDLTGNVDAADYEIWKSTFGSTTDLRADGNQNGIIDAGDYTVWRDHLGGDFPSATGSGSTGSVPEPALIAILGLAIATMTAIPTRRRQ